MSFADIILSGSQALGHIVMSVGTPGTVFFDHVGNLCGQIHIGEDLGSLIAIESCNFKQLIDAFGCTANFFVAFFNRVLPFHEFAVNLLLIFVDKTFFKFRGVLAVAACAFKHRPVSRRIPCAAPHQINKVAAFFIFSQFVLRYDLAVDFDFLFNIGSLVGRRIDLIHMGTVQSGACDLGLIFAVFGRFRHIGHMAGNAV